MEVLIVIFVLFFHILAKFIILSPLALTIIIIFNLSSFLLSYLNNFPLVVLCGVHRYKRREEERGRRDVVVMVVVVISQGFIQPSQIVSMSFLLILFSFNNSK